MSSDGRDNCKEPATDGDNAEDIVFKDTASGTGILVQDWSDAEEKAAKRKLV